jgi:phosphoribosylglycinamide formyltransferase 1
MAADFKVAVFISGRGSNLLSLLESARNYQITDIFSNNAEAPGLAFGASRNIRCHVFTRPEFPTLREFKQAFLERVRACAPNLVALAGFMQILAPEFVTELYGRIINIHPALLPKFAGLHTHARAIEAGERWHGCSVHYVDAGVDTGPIIAQAAVPVHADDTEDTLAARVLEREHKIYPWCVNNIAAGRIVLEGRTIRFAPEALAEAEELEFRLPASSTRHTCPRP